MFVRGVGVWSGRKQSDRPITILIFTFFKTMNRSDAFSKKLSNFLAWKMYSKASRKRKVLFIDYFDAWHKYGSFLFFHPTGLHYNKGCCFAIEIGFISCVLYTLYRFCEASFDFFLHLNQSHLVYLFITKSKHVKLSASFQKNYRCKFMCDWARKTYHLTDLVRKCVFVLREGKKAGSFEYIFLLSILRPLSCTCTLLTFLFECKNVQRLRIKICSSDITTISFFIHHFFTIELCF